MPVNNGVITAPIDAQEVYGALGVGKNAGGIGGYDVGYICSNLHGRINKWAKYKPVRLSAMVTQNVPEWWKGDEKQFGMQIVNGDGYTSMLECVNAIISSPSLTDWTYLPPRGGVDESFRLTDFNGYNNNPYPPIVLSSKQTELSTNSELDFTVFFVLTQVQQSQEFWGNLTIQDLKGVTENQINIDTSYLGVCFVKLINGVKNYTFAISDKTVAASIGVPKIYAENAKDILGVPDTSLENYDVYYFLSTKKDELDGMDNYCMPLPVQPTKLKYTQTDTSVNVYCYNDFNNNVFMVNHYAFTAELSVKIQVQNNSGSPYNIGGLRAEVTYADGSTQAVRSILYGNPYLTVPVGYSEYTVVFDDLYTENMQGAYVKIYGDKNSTSSYSNTELAQVGNIKFNS